MEQPATPYTDADADRVTPLPSLVMAITTADLATDLGVDEGDVAVLLEQLEERDPLADDLAGFLRECLDPHGERTAPAGLYWSGADPRPPRSYGLGGDDPTVF